MTEIATPHSDQRSEKEKMLAGDVGNHFIDSEKRTAKGFAWVMD